jgi:hypothetical protein
MNNSHLKNKAIIFSSADDAYQHFVEETAPDLFM